jgi:ABC-type glycerol-3-phosphate transport system substrate-binding protein
VAKDQEKWLQYMISGEAAARKRAGLPDNPAADLQGLKMQPMLARLSKAWLPTNPVEIYYQEQLNKYTERVLYGQMSPQAALAEVQRLVVADEQRLKAQYGAWNW